MTQSSSAVRRRKDRRTDLTIVLGLVGLLIPAYSGAQTISVAPVGVSEGNSGTTAAQFTVTRSGDTSGAQSVAYSTTGVTATSGTDYVAASGNLDFASGETAKTINVLVNGDVDLEFDETFTLTVGGISATGTILSDDAPSLTLSIGSVSGTEGDSGASTVSFPVSKTPVCMATECEPQRFHRAGGHRGERSTSRPRSARPPTRTISPS